MNFGVLIILALVVIVAAVVLPLILKQIGGENWPSAVSFQPSA